MPTTRSICSVPPPPYNASCERQPLFGNPNYGSTNTPCSGAFESDPSPSSYSKRWRLPLKTTLFITLVFIGAPFCALLGGLAYRSMYKDAVARWANDVGRLKQLAITYREQAMEWHERLTHFEEEVKEKIEQERRERGQARLYWGDFIGSTQCTSSGRRKYHARLLNLTPSLFAIEACKSMPAKINGMTYDTPMYCEDKGREGVFGYWMIENDNMCSTYWDYVVRKDCSAPGSGERRYEAKLGDFHKGGDPEVLCLSTPITFHGQFFARPLACTDRGRGDNPQYWGIWNVPVGDC